MNNENKQNDERAAEADMRAAFLQQMGEPWETALDAKRRIWSLAWGTARATQQATTGDERAAFECMYDRLDAEVSDDLCREDAWVIWQKARATTPSPVAGSAVTLPALCANDCLLPEARATTPQAGRDDATKAGYAFRSDGKLWVVTDSATAEKWREQGFEITPVSAAPHPVAVAGSAGQALHADDAAVDAFAAAMKEKLAQARAKGRGGWERCSPFMLSAMLREHVEKGDPRDVANFCAFLWNLNQPIT